MTTIQLRRNTAAAATTSNPVLAAGELGIETDTGRGKAGDGTTAWNALPYLDAAALASALAAVEAHRADTTDVHGIPDTADLADDAAVVHKTGAETVAGIKTFSSAPVVPDASFGVAKVDGLGASLAAKADLVGGTVPAAQLPSYVDDIIESATFGALPATGETGKLYVVVETGVVYRWSGSAYAEVSASLAIGTTASTAAAGNDARLYDARTPTAHAGSHATAGTDALTPAAVGAVGGTTMAAALGDGVVDLDTFARADGAIGTSDSGNPWTVVAGTVSIASNKASGSLGVAVQDRGLANVDETVRFDPMFSGGTRLVFRLIDASNYLYVDVTGIGLRLRKLAAGAVANLTSTAGPTIEAGATVRVVADGTSVKVYRDGALAISFTLGAADQTKFGAGTKHGLYLSSAARASFAIQRPLPTSAAKAEVNRALDAARATAHEPLRRFTPVAAKNHATATATISISTLGYTYPTSSNRFRGAVVAPDGTLFCLPRDSLFAVLFHPDGTHESTTLGLTTLELEALNISGGTLGPDGLIYSPPRDGAHALIINPRTRTASLEDWGLDMSGADKWTGSVVGVDGRIYCLPTSGADVLIIDPVAQTAERTSYGLTWSGGKQWIGGVPGPDGKIYCVPYNATTVLVIDPLTKTAVMNDYGLTLPGVGAWSGGALGADGRIYCSPRNAGSVLIIDPWAATAELNNFGLAMTAGENKWSRAMTGADGKIYCTPQDVTDLLIIDPLGGSAVRSNLGTTIGTGVQKWIGGALGFDGRIICPPDLAQDFLIIDTTAPDPSPEIVLSPAVNKSP